MNWSDEQKEQIKTNAQKYLDDARSEMESSTILLEHDKYQHSSTFLKQSLKNLIDCYFVVYETSLTDEEEARITSFEELIKSQQLLKKRLVDIPRKISEIDGSQFDDKKIPPDYTRLSDEYQRIFYNLESRFKKLIKTELATAEDKKGFVKRKKQMKFRSVIVAFVLLIVGGGLSLRFNYLKPIRIYYETSQFFWISSVNPGFSETHQKEFRTVANDEFEDYSVKLDQPSKMSQIRFDPAGGQITEVEVDYINLLDNEGKTLHKFDFNAEDPAWTIVNIPNAQKPDGNWRFETTKTDPYIISRPIPEYEVSEIKVRLRIKDRLSFINWILGRNRTRP